MKRIFIDGLSGTTGQKIKGLLQPWQESSQAELVEIENHRSVEKRMRAHQIADVSILCLPDPEAIKITKLLGDINTTIIDTSSAHRTNPDWVYGFPELGNSDEIRNAKRITNPGCFATGAISILRPLAESGAINPQDTVHITGLSGYTGGGKKLIKLHENADKTFTLSNIAGIYSPNKKHKHVDEIKLHSGLQATPIFTPHVVAVPRGMIVSVRFNAAALPISKEELHTLYKDYYNQANSKIIVEDPSPDERHINFAMFAELNTGEQFIEDQLRIKISGWSDNLDQQIGIHALFDNLGKGAGSQAMQNLELVMDGL